MSPSQFLKLLCGALLLGPSLAFFRPNASYINVGGSYTSRGPNYNVTESMLQGFDGEKPGEANSYWFSGYIAAENGHSYFAIACHLPYTDGTLATFISLLDIDTGVYVGLNNATSGTLSNETFRGTGGGVEMYSTTPDLVSGFRVISTVPGASFNWTLSAASPNLFHGGSGTFFFGTGLTNEWAAPALAISGTIDVNGTDVAIIPEKSLSWFDRQWGYGVATYGYYWFNIYLENGVIMALWNTNPQLPTNRTNTFVTVLYPDAHTEIHIADENIHKGGEWVSKHTNQTFYSSFKLTLPTLDAVLNVTVPHHVGEMAVSKSPTPASTLYEGYARFDGTWCGKPISGFGLSEQLQAISI